MGSQTVNISLPKDLLAELDKAAKADYTSRSDFIREAVLGKLRAAKRRADADDWRELERLNNEIADKAERLGYTTDDDFVRAVKEVRAAGAAR